MSDDPEKGKKPLFVETTEGRWVNADNLRFIQPRSNSATETIVTDIQGSNHVIKAPLKGVKEVFARHGYQFASAEDMREAAGPIEPPPSKPVSSQTARRPSPTAGRPRTGGGDFGTII